MKLALIDAGLAVHRGARTPPGERLPASIPQGRTVRTRSRSWWLWPHLLSLDAPLVALVWQRWWARHAGIALPVSREVILGLGVWLIYLADRLADSVDGERRVCGATRHVFSGAYRKFLLPLAVAIALTLVGLAPIYLPAREFQAGLVLLALALGYFWLTHGWPGRGWAVYVPKEAVVGTVFGVGSAFFVVCRSARLTDGLGFGIVLFGLVCFLNCALITRWERHSQDLREPSSLLNAFPRFSARLRLACLVLAGLAVATRCVPVAPVAASAVLLAALDHYKDRLSIDALRVLADTVLLTPCLFLF